METDRPAVNPPPIGILGSTRGSALIPIFAAVDAGIIRPDIRCILSNRRTAGILDKARQQQIPAIHIPIRRRERHLYDAEVSSVLREHGVELILMIGYMRILSDRFVREWRNRVVNIHPSLLPRHAGLMDLEVHASVIESRDSKTGCTLHLVDETVDGGPIVMQSECDVYLNDTPETLKSRVQELEAATFIDFLRNPLKHIHSAQLPKHS